MHCVVNMVVSAFASENAQEQIISQFVKILRILIDIRIIVASQIDYVRSEIDYCICKQDNQNISETQVVNTKSTSF